MTRDLSRLTRRDDLRRRDLSYQLKLYTEFNNYPWRRCHRCKNDRTFKSRVYQNLLRIRTTDWDVFRKNCDTLSDFTAIISNYVCFIRGVCIPKKRENPEDMMKRIHTVVWIKQAEIVKNRKQLKKELITCEAKFKEK